MVQNTQPDPIPSIATRTRIAYWRSVASDPTVAVAIRQDARETVAQLRAMLAPKYHVLTLDPRGGR